MSSSFKNKARNVYFKIGAVKCPAFPKEKIIFNAKGFNHLFYKGDRSGRDKKEIFVRIKLLPLAVKLLKIATILQEEASYVGHFKNKRKEFKFWVFEGVLEERRIKVVIRQIGQGRKHFWSVIPAWRKSKFGKRLNFKSHLRKL